MEHAPYERLKWRVLRYAGALPSEKRAQEMTDADYLYCLVHEMLDREEAMERLCPECRTRAEEARCSICGASSAKPQAAATRALIWRALSA